MVFIQSSSMSMGKKAVYYAIEITYGLSNL